MAKIKGTLVVDKERCKGCSVCLGACPLSIIALAKEVNSKGYNYMRIVEADKCIGCANCAMVCPDGCIVVYREKVTE